MVEQAGNLAGAGQQYIILEMGVSPLSHLLAKRGPRIRADREDDKDLERVETSEGSLDRISRAEICGWLNEATASELDIVQSGHKLLLQEIVTWTDDIAGKTNDWGEERKSVDRRAEISGQYTVGEGVSSKSQDRWDRDKRTTTYG
jgi:hypothetical protein